MANTALTRPVVTMNLANRSIGRFGLLANRVMHPLAAGHFGRQIAPLAVISDLKIVPTETGIVAETSFGNINVDQPVYSRLLGKAGISEIDLPKGTSEDTIGDICRVVTAKTPGRLERGFNQSLFEMAFLFDVETGNKKPFLLFNDYRISKLVTSASMYGNISNFVKLATIGITREQLLHFARSGVERVRTLIARNPKTTKESLEMLASGWQSNDEAAIHAYRRLEKLGLTPDQLILLSRSASPYVRSEITQHPDCPPEALAIIGLGNDEHAWIAFTRLAHNNLLSPELLISLSKSKSLAIRKTIAANSSAPANAIAECVSTITPKSHWRNNPIYEEVEILYGHSPSIISTNNIIGYGPVTFTYLHKDYEVAAQIFKVHDSSKQKDIFNCLKQINPELAEGVRSLLVL